MVIQKRKIGDRLENRIKRRINGVRLNLPRFDAHSLMGTIVPEESEYEQENEKDLQSGI